MHIFSSHRTGILQCGFPLVISNTEDICLDVYVYTAHIHTQYIRMGTAIAFVRSAKCSIFLNVLFQIEVHV